MIPLKPYNQHHFLGEFPNRRWLVAKFAQWLQISPTKLFEWYSILLGDCILRFKSSGPVIKYKIIEAPKDVGGSTPHLKKTGQHIGWLWFCGKPHVTPPYVPPMACPFPAKTHHPAVLSVLASLKARADRPWHSVLQTKGFQTDLQGGSPKNSYK